LVRDKRSMDWGPLIKGILCQARKKRIKLNEKHKQNTSGKDQI